MVIFQFYHFFSSFPVKTRLSPSLSNTWNYYFWVTYELMDSFFIQVLLFIPLICYNAQIVSSSASESPATLYYPFQLCHSLNFEK